jgi:hypothetical protein
MNSRSLLSDTSRHPWLGSLARLMHPLASTDREAAPPPTHRQELLAAQQLKIAQRRAELLEQTRRGLHRS